MTATLATLRQDSRDLLGDTSLVSPIFTTQQIDAWINAAIRDLNHHFPRTISDTLSVTAGDHISDLEINFIAMIRVEYPTGNDPPTYCKWRSSKVPGFWNVAGYYDVLYPQDADSDNPPQLITSQGVTGTITYTAKTEHNLLSSDSDETTVADRYTHLIALFVRYKAWQELSTGEGMNPDPIKNLAASTEMNALRAESSYYKALEAAKKAQTASEVVEWTLPGRNRIY